MPTLTIRNVPEETVRSLKIAAAERGHSMQAELLRLLKERYKSGNPAAVEQVQARIRAIYNGNPPNNMVDTFLAERKADWDE